MYNRVKDILEFISQYNALVLNIDTDPDFRDAELNSIVFTESSSDQEMDILSGYHIFDENGHTLFIEGLDDNGIAQLSVFLSTLDEVLFQKSSSKYYSRQKKIKSATLMHFHFDPSLKKICSWTKTDHLIQKMYHCVNMLHRVY